MELPHADECIVEKRKVVDYLLSRRTLSVVRQALAQCARDLDALVHRWALVGGLAVSARTEPRFTRGVDVVVATTGDPQSEGLVREVTSA